MGLNVLKLVFWSAILVVTSSCGTAPSGNDMWCTPIDTNQMGRQYAEQGLATSEFEKFYERCKKSLSKTDSDVFYNSYIETKNEICKSPKRTFSMTYRSYRNYREPYSCNENGNSSLGFDAVKSDGSSAYKLKRELSDIEKRQKYEQDSERENKHYGIDAFFEGIRRLFFRPDLEKLEQSRRAKVEDLKVISQKYGLFISDLENVRTE